jgi:hypothetical protein
MKRPRLRKRIYTILGLITLLYTLLGACFGFTTIVDCFGPCQRDIRNDPILQRVFILVTGLPLFLLFVFLERRAARDEAVEDRKP